VGAALIHVILSHSYRARLMASVRTLF
jgi:hypothetical protein